MTATFFLQAFTVFVLTFSLIGHSISGLLGAASNFSLSSATAPKRNSSAAAKYSGANGASAGVIPPTFFAVTTINAHEYPAVSFGALGHPTTLTWGWTQPDGRGVFNWQITDHYVELAQEHHVPLMLTIGKTPEWAVGDRSTCRPHAGHSLCDGAPSKLEYWTDFITALATHYKGKVQYYELWNEANQRQFWKNEPEELVALAKAAYPIIKSIDPQAVVLTPSTVGPLQQSLEWMTSYLKAGGGKYADAGSFHGYIAGRQVEPFPGPEQDVPLRCSSREQPQFDLGRPRRNRGGLSNGEHNGSGREVGNECFGSLPKKIQAYRSLFDQYELRGKPMFDTEGSWGNATVNDPDAQISYLARWYIIQAGYYEKANLQQACWYAWGYKEGHTWGVIANSDDTPTPAGQAYSQVYKWLVGSSVAPCTNQESVWTCSISRDASYKGLIVWDASQTCSGGSCNSTPYNPSPGYTHYRDLAGSTKAISGKTIPIGLKPVLLENE